jgi:serine-type D-Ala-D-Ala carboxypeptidase (penicillin-binding protein 5/6)
MILKNVRSAVLLAIAALLPVVVSAGRAPLDPIARDPFVSAIVIDADSGEPLVIKNAVQPVYPASVLKLMDLYVILDLVQQGKVKLDDIVTVSAEASNMGGSQVYLKEHEQFTVDELLFALMIQSANDAAVALAEHIAGSKEAFVSMMNAKAAEIGMKNSTFASVHGLPPAEGQQPDVTTAKDMATLCRALLKFPDTLKYTSVTERGFRDNSFVMQTHNGLLKRVRGCDGFKTGYFRVAGYSIAATAQRDGRRIIAIVMGSESKQTRDNQAAQLIETGFQNLSK